VLGSLTTPYSCLFAPLLAQGLDTAGTEAALRGFARFCRGDAVTRLDAMAADWIGWPLLTAAARASGLAPLRFAHFGNWHESVGPGGWACYLAQRPGALRETIRRRVRRAEALADAHFTLVRRPAETMAGITAYEAVYARSWKDKEPFPCFTAGLIRACAASGTLRLGLWQIGDVPVAVQLWVVERSRATMVKLAHDEAFKSHSPGTVLTAHMLRHLLDREAVTEIDFGRGDDAYKQGWARERRQRDGVLLANPARPAGAVAILRHALGGVRRRLRS
jgi:hypothetical protein